MDDHSIQVPGEPHRPLADCDSVLGAYMRAWNQIGLASSELFAKIEA
jgi:hypothetical protein